MSLINESYGAAEELKEGFDAFLEEWNTLLAHPFRWSYTGQGLHLKAVKRFTKMLNQAASKLEITTMTKQFRLMANLFQNYFDEIPEENWEILFNTIKLQQEILESSIAGEDGPKKKALDHLSGVLENFIWSKMPKAA